MGRRLLPKFAEYRAQAAHCLRRAQAIDHEPTKALLLEMAQQWIKLAEAALDREGTGEEVPLSMPRHPQHMTEQ
jgi:putative IMPACT (imprinted ancient) family translation regulator